MTEQIIIDNIDVTGCVYLCPPKELCPAKKMPYAKVSACLASCKEHNTKYNFCKNNPNCYYKQSILKDKTIELMADGLTKEYNKHMDFVSSNQLINRYTQQAIKEINRQS